MFPLDLVPSGPEAVEAFNAIGAAAKGAAKVFSYPELARPTGDGTLCASSREKVGKLCAGEHKGKTRWFFVGEAGEEATIGQDDHSIETLYTFEVDHDWNYVAVVLKEEGHSLLAAYNLKRWMREKKKPAPFFMVNPDPGTIRLSGWSNNQLLRGLDHRPEYLHFLSDGPVLASDKHNKIGWPIEVMREYHFNPLSGESEIHQPE